ncbi:MAG: energy transducer TonB [Sulfuricellaceae bacterium]|nr:energy transducer TonB [Sulfuricellaceae bacterium]
MAENTETAERFALVLAGSLIFHFALIFGLQIRIQPPQPVSRPVLQVNLERSIEVLPVEASEAVQPQQAEPEVGEPPPSPLPEPLPLPAPLASALPAEQAMGLPEIAIPLVEDPTFYPALEVDVHPAAQHDIMPIYPDKAAADKITGSVILSLLLDESGMVKEISVEESSPPGHFDQAALDAFRHARFSPAQKQGRIVKSRMRIKVSFDLVDKPPVRKTPVMSTPVIDKPEQK